MDKRLELHETLCEIINITEIDGDRHTYYNTPESVKMKYPAIRYKRTKPNVIHANDAMYKNMRAYELTVIDADPDSEIVTKVEQLPYCSFDRSYVSDNLNHTTFTIYY